MNHKMTRDEGFQAIKEIMGMLCGMRLLTRSMRYALIRTAYLKGFEEGDEARRNAVILLGNRLGAGVEAKIVVSWNEV